MFTKMCGQQVDVSQKLRLSLKVSTADLFILFLLLRSLSVWGLFFFFFDQFVRRHEEGVVP